MKNDYSAGLARFRAQLAITRRALGGATQEEIAKAIAQLDDVEFERLAGASRASPARRLLI